MSSNKNKNKTKNLKQEDDKRENLVVDDKLKEELNRYLKIAQEELKNKQIDDEAINELKKKNEEKYEKLKNLKNDNSLEVLYNFSLENLKLCLITELNNKKLNLQNQIHSKELKSSQELLAAQENKFLEIEKHNKMLLERVKEMNEDKAHVEKEEKKRCEDILKKCEDFKQDVINKFQGTDIETIIADNENLKIKLEEYKENTKKITENLELQLKMKEAQNQNFEETFKTQITSKFNELKDQTSKFESENKELKLEYDNGIKKFNKLSASISKYHSKFDVAKNDFEKSLQEIYNLTKENKELKMKDLSELEKENERTKLEVEALVNDNKVLQEKIAKLKEISSNKIVSNDNFLNSNKKIDIYQYGEVENVLENKNDSKKLETEKIDTELIVQNNLEISNTEDK